MYEVIEKFKDKNTGEIYKVGQKVKFTKKRAEEILKVGNFIKKIVEEKVQK